MTRHRIPTAAAALCFLPALPFFIPTFISGCESRPPRVTSKFVGVGRPPERSRDAKVELFLDGKAPTHKYVVVGELEVEARSHNTSFYNALDYAQREARRMGADAILNVQPKIVHPAGSRSHLKLRATAVRWS